MSILSRIHRRYAAAKGYFWLPCPLCGRHFGGHQWRDRKGLPSQIPAPDGRRGISVAICPKCTRSGRGRRLGDA